MDNLKGTLKKEKKVKTEKKINKNRNKNSINFLEIHNLEINHSLNNYRSFVDSDYNSFIPKLIIKKMFYKKENKKYNKTPHLKYNEISSKNIKNVNASSNRKVNIKKDNSNYKKHLEIDIPIACSLKKNLYKNNIALTEFDKLSKNTQNNAKNSSSKYKQQNQYIKNSKTTIVINGRNPKITYNNNLINKNIKKNNNRLFNKALKDIKEIKLCHNLKKSFVNKNNFMINVNIYNNFKINTETSNDTIRFNKNKIVNNSLKQPYINKNNIDQLLKNRAKLFDNNKFQKRIYNKINLNSKTIKDNTSINAKK